MAPIREWLRRVWRGGQRSDPDLDAELQLHLELLTEEKLQQGHSPAEATRLARIEAGGLAQAMESMRDQRSFPWLEDAMRDGQLALRLMRRGPLFTVVAVVSLALGIGANTAIFSLVNTLMLRPLPVQEPERLVELLSRYPGEPRGNVFQWRVYEHFREQNKVFSDLIALSPAPFQVGGQGFEAGTVSGEYVVGSYFQVLGVKPAAGRFIGSADDQSGAAPVAVISWSFWQSRFNRDPAALGQRITVNGVAATVIGVAPAEFIGLNIAARPNVWIPAAVEALLQQPSQRAGGTLPVALIGRLKPGVSLAQARAEMRVLDQWRVELFAKTAPHMRALTLEVESAATGLSMLRDRFAKPLVVLSAVVGLLLLIACTNVAGMLLARGAARQREMVVRLSLGAPRFRLVRQLLTEAMLLAAIGGVVGVALAYLGVEALVGILTSGRRAVGMVGPLHIDARLDGQVLLFTVAISSLAGLLFGLAPAWHALTSTPASTLRVTGAAAETRSRRLVGKSLVVAQIAVSLVLLSTAGLFIRHLSTLRNVGLGFDRQSVLLVTLDPTNSGYQLDQLFQPYRDLLARLETIPGVRAATLSGVTPIHGAGAARFVNVEGFQEAPAARRRPLLNFVGPRYFETFGTPMIAGRDFRFDDRGRPSVAIVNQAMERYYFAGRSAIGQHLSFDTSARSYEIVGVVADAKYLELHDEAPRTVYVNAFQESRMSSTRFSVRTSVPPTAVAAEVRRAVAEVLKTVPVSQVTTLADQVDASIVPERMVATLSGLFGGLAAILVGIGLYGLLAYTVARRINEIGIRMTLGATKANVTGMVLKGATALVAIGFLIGMPVALWSQRVAAGWVGNVKLDSLLPIASAAIAIVGIALLSAYVPARRAARVDPAEALRRD